MIDIHCHLLPGIDDGPPTVEAALALARAMVADGITIAVTTPHVFPGRYDNTRASITQACAEFRQILQREGIKLELHHAGEVRLSDELPDQLHTNEIPYLGGPDAPRPRAMLLELPDGQVPLGTDKLCSLLSRNGVLPIIAHPERNRGIMDRLERAEPLLDAGCRFQLTAGSLLGEFGTRAHDAAWALLQGGGVVAVASDAHNLSGRAPRMGAARALLVQRAGEKLAQQLMFELPARLCGFTNPRGQVG